MATSTLSSHRPSLPAKPKQQHLRPKSYVIGAEGTSENHLDIGSSPPKLFTGQGEDEAPRSLRRNMHKKSGSLRMNGFSREKEESRVIVERFEDKEGEHLVSIKPVWSDTNGKRTGSARTDRNELLSGRRAGARWEQSQYASWTS